MSDYFYLEQPPDGFIHIPPEEARHLIKVLRKKEGDNVYFTDGKGTRITAVLEDSNYDHCLARIIHRDEVFGKRPYRLHMAIAPTKQADRIEWFVEKATETGVDEITPIVCAHSERKELRTDRLKKIAISAMKQSQQAWLPHINEATDFREILSASAEQKFICHLEESTPVELAHSLKKGGDLLILIGPEGDFSKEEVEKARSTGFTCVALGNHRLRTETAGLVACSTVSIINL